MSEAIPSWARVGAKVVCVDGAPHAGAVWAPDDGVPVVGETYTVAQVFIDHARDACFHLVEISRGQSAKDYWGDNVGYRVNRFRPLVSQADDIATFFAHHLNIRAPETV